MINLYEILQTILTENVSSSDIINAIRNKVQVIITYSDEKNRAPKKRLIEPYVYGISKGGNNVLRAFQYQGDTFRGIPKWKLFRLDRITSWQPTNNHFNIDPKSKGWDAPPYNESGDNSMSIVLNQVDLSDNDNPYDKNSDLYILRQKTNRLKQSNPININQMKLSSFGPNQNQKPKDIEFQNSSPLQKQLNNQLNIKNTNTSDNNINGPIINNDDDTKQDNNQINNVINEPNRRKY